VTANPVLFINYSDINYLHDVKKGRLF